MKAYAWTAYFQGQVLKDLSINDEGPNYIHIEARRSGFLGWFMSCVGVEATTKFDVYDNCLVVSKKSLFGFESEMIPLSLVCNFGSAQYRPIVLLTFAFGLFGLSLLVYFLMNLSIYVPIAIAVGGLGCLISYFLLKTLVLYLIPCSGVGTSIAVRRSVIERKKISEDQARRIVARISRLIEDKSTAKKVR